MRPAGTPLALDVLNDMPEPTWRFLLGRGLPQLAVEGIAPVLVFYGAWRAGGLGLAVGLSTLLSHAVAAHAS